MAVLVDVPWLRLILRSLAPAALRVAASIVLGCLPLSAAVFGAPTVGFADDRELSAPPVLAFVDIGLVDSAGAGSSPAEDKARSNAVTSAILSEVAEGGVIATVFMGCKGGCRFDAAGVEDLRRRAHSAGATHVLAGNVRRIGEKVALMRVSVLQTSSGHMVLDRAVTFRADSDAGWSYAAMFLSREVAEALVAAAP